MHVPDGVIGPDVCAAAGAISLGAVGYSLHKLSGSLADRAVPMTGMMAALVFAGQMVNFPLVGPPVSGHLMGGVLASVVLGPWAGCVAVTLVLLVQCLLFADGGLLALGVNTLNMAVAGALGGYMVYSLLRRLFGEGPRSVVGAAVAAAWISVMAAATLFCGEFWLTYRGGGYDFGRIFTLMVSFHSAIGVGEALITGVVVGFVLAQRPDLVYRSQIRDGIVRGLGRAVLAGVVMSLAVAAFLAPFASSYADGLEAVGTETGFEEKARDTKAAFADYDAIVPGWEKVSVSLSGIIGVAAVFAIALVLGRVTVGRMQPAGPPHAE
ncbi:MAG: energy-coupling factor ABC transporter permease [Planctomycetes bacterium]|nr:energy-coupling factor ABC transporter permease [Planctomycetota bacterium]